MVRSSGAAAKQDSSEPSRPSEGPEIKFTSRSGLRCKPNTEAMVFSWAPPTINRVMTCVARIRVGGLTLVRFGGLKLLQTGADGLGFFGVGGRVGEVKLVILDDGRDVLLTGSNLG